MTGTDNGPRCAPSTGGSPSEFAGWPLSTVRATATITLVGLLPGALGLGAGAVLQVRRSEGSN